MVQRGGLFRILYLLLAILAAWVCAQATWRILAANSISTTESVQTSVTPHTSPKEPSGSSVNSILTANLFGTTAGQKITVKKKKRITSRLKLNVVGVIMGEGTMDAAIISHSNKQRTYLTGENIDLLGSRVFLREVHPDHIVIERSGVEEIISIRQRKSPLAIETVPELNDARANLKSPAFRKLIGDARETVSTNPLSLIKYFQIEAVSTNGQLSGYRLNPGNDKRLFERLKLKAGDLLTEINGQPVSELPLATLPETLKNSAQIELTLERNHAPFQLTLLL